MSSGISESSGSGSGSVSSQLQNRDFKIIVDLKPGEPQATVHLIAPTIQVSFIFNLSTLQLGKILVSFIIKFRENFYPNKYIFSTKYVRP